MLMLSMFSYLRLSRFFGVAVLWLPLGTVPYLKLGTVDCVYDFLGLAPTTRSGLAFRSTLLLSYGNVLDRMKFFLS